MNLFVRTVCSRGRYPSADLCARMSIGAGVLASMVGAIHPSPLLVLIATCSEFQGLWKYIVDWQQAFKYFDRDGSGTIDGHELANALRQFGYNLSPTILSLLEQKYGKSRGNESAPLHLPSHTKCLV